MGFWGIEVKPGKPYPYHSDNVPGKLHVTQATLGTGSSSEKSILRCSSGHKTPVFLCSLLPNKIESCPLNLEFDDHDIVAFSVIGPRSIHLSGYFVSDGGDDLRDDYGYDSFGEDIEGTETEESSEYDTEDEYADGFIDDSDIDMYPSSHVPNSGVKIEEIVDDDDPANGDDPTQQLDKKKQIDQLKKKDSKSSQLPVVVSGDTDIHDLESEDEDGFPISAAEKSKSEFQKTEAEMKAEQGSKKTDKANKKAKYVDHSASLKRKVESTDEEEQHQDGKKKKKNKKMKENGKVDTTQASGNNNETAVTTPDEIQPEEAKTTPNPNNVSHAKDDNDGKLSNNDVPGEKKNKRKKKKNAKDSEGEATANQIDTSTAENQKLSASERKGKKQTEGKPSQVRTFPNGLVIEEIQMGEPNGKKAAPGKKVSVKYIGKLQKDGKIFDSNVGRAPFKFRLGVGQVIKGWEVGINGMRIGDKRRITVPPSMGYGDKRVGTIPQNSWLVFDVELVGVDS